MSTVKAQIRAGIRIPLKQLDEFTIETIERENTWHLYKDKFVCKRCDQASEKPANCRGCENYERHVFFKRAYVSKTDKEYMILRRGYRTRLTVLLDDLEIQDKQTYHPMAEQRYKFDLTMLNEGQREAVDKIVAHLKTGGSGALKSPPRTGKTVMMAAVALVLKRKTIIFAHQQDLLTGPGQLYDTFTQKTSATAPQNPNRYFTNFYKFIDKGKVPIKFCRTLKDFEETDVCLTTYQLFLSPKGQKLLEQIHDKFGLLLIDEYHRMGARGYSDTVDRFTCPKFGVSATPKRKDGRHRVAQSVVGDVYHETSIDSLSPIMSVVRTGLRSKKQYKLWTYMLRFLENQPDRISLIVQFAKKDVKKGNRNILIPVAHSTMIDTLVERLNKAGIPAVGWDARIKPKERHVPLNMARSGEVRVTVARRSMLTGINVPRWDTLYWVEPMNNDPNFEQEFKRICTPMPGKLKPVVRFFVDDYAVVERCFFNCASVIKRLGGTFTEAAKTHWELVGFNIGKLKAGNQKTKHPASKAKAVKGLFDDEEDDNYEVIEIQRKEPRKRAGSKPKSNLDHLAERL